MSHFRPVRGSIQGVRQAQSPLSGGVPWTHHTSDSRAPERSGSTWCGTRPGKKMASPAHSGAVTVSVPVSYTHLRAHETLMNL
eukprot:306939-Prymnesium_polylepis.2